MTEPRTTREWLMQIDTGQASIFRELTDIKKDDLGAIITRLDILNGHVAANTERSIHSEACWGLIKLAAKIGIPVTAGVLIGTNCYGLW